jgi:nucleoside-diphosphate-sugar epimerase
LAAGRGLPFLTLGTRKVYAHPRPAPLREDDPTGPTDRYGEQKLAIEQALLAILGDRLLTRLRLSNVFGHEPGRRRSWAGCSPPSRPRARSAST